MRQPRIKIAAEEGEAAYHCMSRTVNGERLFDAVAKEVLRTQLWQVADYCGVQILTRATVAQQGLMSVFGGTSWPETQAGYRQVLFGSGAGPRESKGRIPMEELQEVLRAGGQLPLATVLRCRMRYFTDGAVLGSKAFVAVQLAAYRQCTGKRQQSSPRPLPPLTDWGDLATLRGLRRGGFGGSRPFSLRG